MRERFPYKRLTAGNEKENWSELLEIAAVEIYLVRSHEESFSLCVLSDVEHVCVAVKLVLG